MESIHRGSNDNAAAVQNNALVSTVLSGQAGNLLNLVALFKIAKKKR
jgi:methyl-accepting chemotaxis protein